MLIIAKTCPCKSKKYGELVCTVGITTNNEMVRLYPIPFRKLDKSSKYSKYQFIYINITKDLSDPRKESFKIQSPIKLLEKIDTSHNWLNRKKIILSNREIFNEKNKLLEQSHDIHNGISLAIFKPCKINSFIIKKTNNENNPYKFYYNFSDINDKKSQLQIIDWEIFALTHKLITKYKDFNIIKDKLRKTYYDFMKTRDIYLFLGTNRKWHIRKSKNPFMIIGIFYPPLDKTI